MIYLSNYVVSRCHSDDTLYGDTHSSQDANTTTCGIEMDGEWYILVAVTGDHIVSCPDCSASQESQPVDNGK